MAGPRLVCLWIDIDHSKFQPRSVSHRETVRRAHRRHRLVLQTIEVLRMGIFSGYFRLAAAMFEGSNVQWRLGKIAFFHIADKLRRQLTRQG